MKPLILKTFATCRSSYSLLASAGAVAVALLSSALRAEAQNDHLGVSAAEFQRLVYSAHLLTQLEEKPELDASLQVLLELQRRNPQAHPAGLAALLQEALVRYRTASPAGIRTRGFRDEVLAAYVEAFQQVPSRTNFVPVDLAVLNYFMLQPEDHLRGTAAELMHSGNRRLLTTEGQFTRRQALLDTCTARAQSDVTFAAAMDNLLGKEALIWLDDTPEVIIGSSNSPLHDSVTLRKLLALSLGSGDGSVTISSNELVTLFSEETQTIWGTIHTNLAMRAEIGRSQPDLFAYLADPTAVSNSMARVAAVQQGQARRIAGATAAILVQSRLIEAKDPLFKMPKDMARTAGALANIAAGISTIVGTAGIGAVAGVGPLTSGSLELINIMSGEETPEEATMREIGNIKILLADLSSNLDYRFDRVDETLNYVLREVAHSLTLIGELGHDVDEVRQGLLDVQNRLNRIEGQLFTGFNQTQRNPLVLAMNGALFNEVFTDPMSYETYSVYENTFCTYATDYAENSLSSPSASLDLSPLAVRDQLLMRPLDANLNYLKQLLATLSGNTGGGMPLSNPRDWFTSASAYLQLAVENPVHFRRRGLRVAEVIRDGENLTKFLRTLTFAGSGSELNASLWNALQTNYSGRLGHFVSQVHASEQDYADRNGFDLSTWRNWVLATPRFEASSIEVTPQPVYAGITNLPGGAVEIAAGARHSMALMPDGSVVCWGRITSVPAAAQRGVVAIAAGAYHSLALKADGKVLCWGGLNLDHELDVPGDLANVVAIAGGDSHSLALMANGKVRGWGSNARSQIGLTDLSDVVAIAAGAYHSVALKADGKVVLRGALSGEYSNPSSPYVAIAAGGYLGENWLGSPEAKGHTLALRADGRVVAWGDNDHGQCDVPSSAQSGVVGIAAGGVKSLALKANGAVAAWGLNLGGVTVPGNMRGIAAGGGVWMSPFWWLPNEIWGHCLALPAAGPVFGWGDNSEGQINVPALLRRKASAAQCMPEIVCDTASGHFDGRLFNGTTWTTGVVLKADSDTNGAVSFDGVDDYVIIPNFGNRVPSDEVTVEFWARVRQRTENSSIFVLKDDNFNNRFLVHLGRTDNRVFWDFGDASLSGPNSGRLFYTNSLDILGSWQHFAFVASQSKTNMKIFHNGIEVRTENQFNAFAPGSYELVLGSGFVGDLDEFRIWKVARSREEIAANMSNRLTGAEVNLVAYWSFNDGPGTGMRDVAKIAAGQDFSVALRTNGTVMAWGVNELGQCMVPPKLDGITEIAAGLHHSLALTTNGSLVAWGWSRYGLIDVPVSAQGDVVDMAAGASHNLALKNDGSVVAWGGNAFGQTNVPRDLRYVVAVAAGGGHSLALKADATIVPWGWNAYGQTSVPPKASGNVVAIAAGDRHSLALLNTGEVVAWGWNGYGQTHVPIAAQAGVISIAALMNHNLALKADGTVVWGENTFGQTNLSPGLTNIVAIAAGSRHNVFLRATPQPVGEGTGLDYSPAEVPSLITKHWLRAVGAEVIRQLDLPATSVRNSAIELSGAKMLIQSVLELGMPYTLEQDEVLHGLLYGTESLADLEVARRLFSSETNHLFATPCARPYVLEDLVHPGVTCFFNRLHERLLGIQAAGEPEIPRMVGHTLRLLNLLREAHAITPAPALTLWMENNLPCLRLYGEPYTHYTLQHSDTLSSPNWTTTTINNLHNEQIITPPGSAGTRGFYRALRTSP